MIKKYITDINNKIYLKEEIVKNLKKKTDNFIRINNKEITKFLGFGSAITESSAYNYQKLSNKNKELFIHDYYSKSGLNYHFGRISIGSNDFSLNSFSYAKKRNLSDFTIAHDKELVIPFLKDILNKKDISLIASPWSPPVMFKRLPILFWGIKLRKKYYENYSDYLVKFVNEYKRVGINVDYLTIQNEPMARQRWESCKFSLNNQKEFIYKYLINKLDNTKILLWDHNKDDLYNIINKIYCDDRISGFAFHYYTGSNFNELAKLRKAYPDKLLINTEMCCAYSKYDEIKWISSAEYYLNDIIGDMNSGVNAYLDWNILLDEFGGPTYKNNPVKSGSIRLNDDYIKTPIYYYLYHVSHFISNSLIIENDNKTNLKVASFKSNKKLIIVILNKTNNDIDYKIINDNKTIVDSINKHSIITYEIE
jgi:glucosylceramidase